MTLRNRAAAVYDAYAAHVWRGVRGVAAMIAFCALVAEPALTLGDSMYPTVRSGDLVIIDHLSSIENGGIQRGDVVCAFTPDSLVAVVKRLIALPGDRIRVNPDERFEQPIYTTIPRGHVWLAGDNPPQSSDSRQYGPLPQALVSGKVRCVAFPVFERIATVPLDRWFSSKHGKQDFVAEHSSLR